jgi:hypothetical protein
MAARIWLGGRGNQASDRLDWSPNGVPQPGDALTITQGSININGNQIGADVLDASGTARVSIKSGINDHLSVHDGARVYLTNTFGAEITKSGGDVSLTTTGVNQADIQSPARGFGGNLTIANHGTLIGSVGLFGSSVRLNGGTFVNTGTSLGGFDEGSVVINADVLGIGNWRVSTFHAPFGELQFLQSVGPGQTVTMEGGFSGYALLDIKHPGEFQAAINFSANSVIDLDGVAATSWAYSDNGGSNGALYLYSGPNNQTVDVLRFTDTSGTAFGIAQGTSTGGKGVEIFASGYPNIPHSSDLLLHL